MAQTSITNYFNKRKRPIDDIKAKTKVMVLDQELFSCTESIKTENNCDANIVFKNTHEFPHSVRSSASIRSDVKQHKMVSFDLPEIKAPKNYADKGKKVTKVTSSPGYDIRETFRKSSSSIKLAVDSVCSDSREVVLHEKSKLTSQETLSISSVNEKVNVNECVFVITEGTKAKPNVPFEQLGSLSPYKNTSTQSQPTNNVTLSDYALNEAQDLDKQAKIGNPNRTNDARKELGLMSPTKSFPRKEPSLEEIKARLSRSEKLRASIAKFSKGAERIKQLEDARRKIQLNEFTAIELEVSTSPLKTVYNSPHKSLLQSPAKGTRSPLTSPSKGGPAYQWFDSLASPVSLPLPYSYRNLVEMFRSLDTVVSMLYNRGESVTYRKLRPAIQEMTHKNFTERYLAQIKTVLPNAYMFHQEKSRNFGSTSKTDKYELFVTPILDSNSCGEGKLVMSPAHLLERKRLFYNNLLERVHLHHDEFLNKLDPPMVIPRSKLFRWHPEFEVDKVAEIVPDELPEAPNEDTLTSARDVLDRAKNLFSYNQRMEKALENVIEDSSKNENAIKSKSDQSDSPLSAALKGLPKALLQKVRAKQAAKALQVMTRSPAQDKEALQYSRLPEIARILRNLFIVEKKGVLLMDFVIQKLGHSYRESLTSFELKEHIHLLLRLLPGWLVLHNIRNANYLKLSKNGDMSKVTNKLESLAAKKNNLTLLST